MPRHYKILMVSNRYLPIVGGAERQASQLIAQLQARGHTVRLVTRRIDVSLPQEDMIQGVPIRRLSPVGLSHWANVLIVFRLFLFLVVNARTYDIIHCHTLGPVGLAAILAHIITHKPVILKIALQGDVIRDDGTRSRYSLFVRHVLIPSWLWRFILNRASAIIAISQALYDEAKGFGIQNVVMIPNGVDIARFSAITRTQARERLGLADDQRYLLFTGRLIRLKRVDVLLDAMPRILVEYPNCHALIVGSGEHQKDSSEFALHAQAERLNITEHVHFLGLRDDIPLLLRAADVYVFTSEKEGLPNAILEAAAAGLPIVATRIDGVTDILDDTCAWLVPVGDVTALAQAVNDVLHDESQAQARANHAYQHIVSAFSIQAVAQRYETLYADIMDRDTH